jgi:hypothetical protein
VAEAVYTARYHRVLAFKLTAQQKLRHAQCHGAAAELDSGEADPSYRGAGVTGGGDWWDDEDPGGGREGVEEPSGSPPEGSRAAIPAPVIPPSLSPLVRPGEAFGPAPWWGSEGQGGGQGQGEGQGVRAALRG